MNSKILIGVIFVVVILVIFAAIFILRDFGSYRITILYTDANGLKSGDLVYIRGVEIGVVKKIIFVNNSVKVVTQISNSYKQILPVDSRFYIKSDILITRKKCIDIDMGKSMVFLRDKDIVKGITFNWLNKTTNKISELFKSGSWTEVVEETRQSLEEAKEYSKVEFLEIWENSRKKTLEYYEQLKEEMPERADSFMVNVNDILEKYKEMK